MHSCQLSHKYEQHFVKATFSNFIIFKVKSTFEPNVHVWKKQGLSTLEVWVLWICEKNKWFVISFEHVNFSINEKYSKKLCHSKLLCFPCDLSNIQKFNFEECPLTWWLLLLCFYPFWIFKVLKFHVFKIMSVFLVPNKLLSSIYFLPSTYYYYMSLFKVLCKNVFFKWNKISFLNFFN